ncbi:MULTISPECIES: alpha/beta hydrolase [unclassified Caulobacter]|uniref:alpha/beta hydrolase n=1 Tax=unclassified Caulobacter TaxID=2648921 RepID=UPI0006FEA18A|nr:MULTISPECIES: alpha/beta hydrolase [unclassified Caulobacter]KQV57373.1 esterase [Caulobacter sp. Root342]KQV66945.1 esterase [Caulobacter sp. Root343]
MTTRRCKTVMIALAAALLASAGAVEAAQLGPGLRGQLRQRLQQKKAEEERPIDLQAIAPGARKQTDAYGTDAAQRLDVYIPPGARDAPILIMVHGGAWMVGDKANTGSVENKLKHWLTRGWIVVSVNYRMLPDAMAFEQAQDVAEAVQWAQGYAEDWGGDPRKIILMGHSAGAHLVALVSSKPELVGQPWAGTVVLDSAVMQLSRTMAGRHPGFYDRAFGDDPAYWTKASPMDQWTPKAVPMMLVCSTQRPDDPCDDARRFQAKAAAGGRDMPVLPQDLSHADINRTLGLPSAYTNAVDAFIARRLSSR